MTAGVDTDTTMRRALDAGLPPELLAVLVAARKEWRDRNEGCAEPLADPNTVDAAEALWHQELRRALAHPAAPTYDEVFIASMRRENRGQ